jgi:hypothetical protein
VSAPWMLSLPANSCPFFPVNHSTASLLACHPKPASQGRPTRRAGPPIHFPAKAARPARIQSFRSYGRRLGVIHSHMLIPRIRAISARTIAIATCILKSRLSGRFQFIGQYYAKSDSVSRA